MDIILFILRTIRNNKQKYTYFEHQKPCQYLQKSLSLQRLNKYSSNIEHRIIKKK